MRLHDVFIISTSVHFISLQTLHIQPRLPISSSWSPLCIANDQNQHNHVFLTVVSNMPSPVVAVIVSFLTFSFNGFLRKLWSKAFKQTSFLQ